MKNLGRGAPWGHQDSIRTRPQASGLPSDPSLIHGFSPRGFVVLGEHFSFGWILAGVALVLAMALASAVEEREAARERHQLEHQALSSAELAVHALGEEEQCEALLAACTQALGHGESCSCWLDDDASGGTWR